MRAAMLTESETTVDSMRPAAPTRPSVTGPRCTPTPTPAQAETRPLGDYVVPGKRQPVGVYEVFAGDPPETRLMKKTSRAAVSAAVGQMTAGELESASAALQRLVEACPNDQVLRALVDECRRREGRA